MTKHLDNPFSTYAPTALFQESKKAVAKGEDRTEDKKVIEEDVGAELSKLATKFRGAKQTDRIKELMDELANEMNSGKGRHGKGVGRSVKGDTGAAITNRQGMLKQLANISKGYAVIQKTLDRDFNQAVSDVQEAKTQEEAAQAMGILNQFVTAVGTALHIVD